MPDRYADRTHDDPSHVVESSERADLERSGPAAACYIAGLAKAVPMGDDLRSWLDEALHALIVDGQRSLRELLNAYDALEGEAVVLLSEDPNPQRVVDVQRELASLRLTAVKQRGGSAADALSLFQRREQLGYTSKSERVIATAIFARICLADGHPELERGELDDALASVPPGTHPSIEEFARVLDAAKRRP